MEPLLNLKSKIFCFLLFIKSKNVINILLFKILSVFWIVSFLQYLNIINFKF